MPEYPRQTHCDGQDHMSKKRIWIFISALGNSPLIFVYIYLSYYKITTFIMHVRRPLAMKVPLNLFSDPRRKVFCAATSGT